MELFSQEEILIRDTVGRIAREKIAPYVDEAYRQGKASPEILRILNENRLLIVTLPKHFGGIEANAPTRAIVIEEVAKVDASTSCTYLRARRFQYFS